jgi:hypothetical protein
MRLAPNRGSVPLMASIPVTRLEWRQHMLSSAAREDQRRVEAVDLCGDFASGQRGTLPTYATRPCDFATGLRHRDAPPVTGDFAGGMRTVAPRAPAIAGFATGQRRGESA